MTKKRRTYDKEFKEQAVNMVLNQGLTRAEVSRRLGVDYNSITNWVKKAKHGETEKDGELSAHEAVKKIKKLEKLLAEQRMENEFLKKQQNSLQASPSQIPSNI